MSNDTPPSHTGGCQCGAIRYRIDAALTHGDICHCRMCQKAGGNLFGAFVSAPFDKLVWTRGQPKTFKSSAVVERRFCADCGTNLAFHYVDKAHIGMTLGSLDDPARVPVTKQFGIEARMPWFDTLPQAAASRTEDEVPPERAAKFASRQHPDHDTDVWPANGDAS
jgi:hypothetical protein